MKLEHYIECEVESLQRFLVWWIKQNKTDPENFPLEFETMADWHEQYVSWVETEECPF